MKELWSIMNILDNADDVAMFVVGARDQKILYCNHLVTVCTNAHAGVDASRVWDQEDMRKAISHVDQGGVYRYLVEKSNFGGRKNVTVCKVVWSQGMLAYAFLLTSHVDDREEEEREKIFGILGRSYRSIFLLDMMKGEVTTLLKPLDNGESPYHAVYYHPVRFDEWCSEIMSNYVHPDDRGQVEEYFDAARINREISSGSDYAFRYRKKTGEDYIWVEMRFLRLDEMEGKVVCAERSIDGEGTANEKERENEIIMKSLSNAYRSVYLLDMKTGRYTTVKQDEFLFGIPLDGDYEVLRQLVSELIPDEGQKNDYMGYFSLEGLRSAFRDGAENVGREYNSTINTDDGWMGANAFKPPYMPGMENKCVLTFMDITEHKRVEAERNEKNIVIDILSSRYICVYFVSVTDGSFHSIRVPQEYRYIEKQFDKFVDALEHYAKAYVIEQYRDFFKFSSEDDFRGRIEEYAKREYVYRTVQDKWIRLNIFPIRSAAGALTEVVIAFENYDDMMEQHELSLIYNATLLADYDVMYEYDADTGVFYMLAFDGQRIIREAKWENVEGDVPTDLTIHPDDMNVFRMALSAETIRDNFNKGKTVSHVFLRDSRGTGEYRLFMYAFHYYEEMGKGRVLIMGRDADRENV